MRTSRQWAETIAPDHFEEVRIARVIDSAVGEAVQEFKQEIQVAEQQIREFWEGAAKVIGELATEFLDIDNPNDKLALDFANIARKMMLEKRDLPRVEPHEASAKVAEQQFGELREFIINEQCKTGFIGEKAKLERVLGKMTELSVERMGFHGTHGLRPPAPQSPRVTCPAVEGDMACQEDLGHPVPHRYCAGKGQPVYTWPIR